MERHDRIALAIKASGKKKGEIASECGVANSAVTQWIDGSSKGLKPENLFALAKATGFSAEWLAVGEGPERGMHAESEVEPGPPIMSAPRRVDIVGTAQLGEDGFWDRIENGVEGWVETWTKDPDAYALRLKGDSMSPAIRSGWIAVCEPNHPRVLGEYVMVTLMDGRSMVKELTFERKDEVVLSSINAEYERRTYSWGEIEKIHYVGNIMAPSKVMCRL